MLADMHVSATLAVSKAWQKQKQAAGWACMHWPVQAGGHGASLIERVLWQQEEGVHGKLAGIFIIGQGMIAPTLMACAAAGLQPRYLPPLASGDEVWCQLFSQPVAGSDLAGLRARAEPTAITGWSMARRSGPAVHSRLALWAVRSSGLKYTAQPGASARFQAMLMRSPATRIEGGTDEMLRNIIAERVLGLPADLRADRGMPFNQIPTPAR